MLNFSAFNPQTERSRLRSELGLEDGEEAPLRQREELEELRYDNDRLKADLEKARKVSNGGRWPAKGTLTS